MDAVAVGEDVPLHVGVPPPGLMSEVDAGFQQRLHCHWFAWGCRLDGRGRGRRRCAYRRLLGLLYHTPCLSNSAPSDADPAPLFADK